MTKTLEELGQHLRTHKTYTHIQGRESLYCIPDVFDKGVELLIKCWGGAEVDAEGEGGEGLAEETELGIDADDLSIDF